MKTYFHLLFYKFFQFSKKVGNVDDDSFYAFKAIAFLTILFFSNILSLWLTYNIIKQEFQLSAIPVIVTLIILFSIGGGLRYYFLRNDHYKKVVESIQRKPKLNGKKGGWITILYVIGSFVVLFGLAFIISLF